MQEEMFGIRDRAVILVTQMDRKALTQIVEETETVVSLIGL